MHECRPGVGVAWRWSPNLDGKRPRRGLLPPGPQPEPGWAENNPVSGADGLLEERKGEEHPTTDLLTNASDAVGVTCEQANGPGRGATPGPFALHDLRITT